MPYRLKPIFKTKPWGNGQKMKSYFRLDSLEPGVGECWGVSALSNNESLILDGPYKQKTLAWLWKHHRNLFGNHPSDQFPILVKIIEASEDLSIQVHPHDAYAIKHESSLGKAECWYILDAAEDTHAILGHSAKSVEELQKHLDAGSLLSILKKQKIKKNDQYQILPGTLHAILKNTFLLEIQQSSDVTYRLYDYERVYQGTKRELHLDHCWNVIKIPDKPIENSLSTSYFKTTLHNKSTLIKAYPYGLFLVVTRGTVSINQENYPQGTFLFATNKESLAIKGEQFELVEINILNPTTLEV